MTKQIEIINVQTLLGENTNYLIPVYQRDYAWDVEEVRQLLNDIASACFNNKKRYYIGTIVLAALKNGGLEVIDGQQRFTTLHLINAALENFCDIEAEAINLHFSKLRPNAERFLNYIYRVHNDLSIDLSNIPVQMVAVYSHIQCIWDEVLENYTGENTQNDTPSTSELETTTISSPAVEPTTKGKKLKDYIKSNVKLAKVCVPEGTDLCRYFEISNSRGEQLEKHEILKARLISHIKNIIDRRDFSNIWDQCSDMTRFYCADQNSETSHQEPFYMSLNDILSSENPIDTQTNTEMPMEQKRSVIDFPNFLMLALRVFIGDDKIPLDDTRLLDVFDEYLEQYPERIIPFSKKLSELRSNFDDYIIWSIDDQWHIGKAKSINEAQKCEENTDNGGTSKETAKRILALQTMFHSAYPSRNYKYWLYYALKECDLSSIKFWEKMARMFLSGRYASETIDYSEIMSSTSRQVDENRLRYGNPVVFALKLFDYILWRDSESSKYGLQFSTDRNSIEHFYPQHPIENHPRLSDTSLHQFGNLCLVSSSDNSRFTNNMPEAKCSNFANSDHKSIKLKLMMKQCLRQDQPWRPNENASNIEDTINKNTQLAVAVFNAYLSDDDMQMANALSAVNDAYTSPANIE